MSQYAVLHITKFKTLGGIGEHIDRIHISNNVNPDKTEFNETLKNVLGSSIDGEKTHLTKDFSGNNSGTLKEDINRRIKEGYTGKKAIRKDAVLAMGVILTGSHERMKEIEANDKTFDAWKKANYEFACREFGKENIVRFTLHVDEKTPHFHCVFVPITPKGSLSARHFVGDKSKLRAYQDRYSEIMKPFGFSRGVPRELTDRKHITNKEYYHSVNKITHDAKEAAQEIKKGNLFKLDQVRNEVYERIGQLDVKASQIEHKATYSNITNERLMDQTKKEAYLARLKAESAESLRIVKSNVNLIDMATQQLGWQIDKQKSSKQDVVLKHETHGVIIAPSSPKRNNGHWVFSWADRDGGGTLVDLLRLEEWDWKEIKGLSGKISSPTPVAELPTEHTPTYSQVEKDTEKQEAMAKERFNSFKASEMPSYIEKRGVERTIYQDMPQVKVNEKEAIFKLYNLQDDKARVCSTIHYSTNVKGGNNKYFQKGLPRGLSVMCGKERPERIVITESPIDALSWKQVEAFNKEKKPPNTMYVSTCGNITKSIQEDISLLFKEAKIQGQSVVVARDNDPAGIKISNTISNLAEQQGIKVSVSAPPEGKDWNDYLLRAKSGTLQESTKESEGQIQNNSLSSRMLHGLDKLMKGDGEEWEDEDKKKRKKGKQLI